MHKVGTLAGFFTAFLVYAVGVLRGNSMTSLLARAGIAFAAAYLMILFFGLFVVFSSSSKPRQPAAPEPSAPKEPKKPGRDSAPAGQPFSIPEQR